MSIEAMLFLPLCIFLAVFSSLQAQSEYHHEVNEDNLQRLLTKAEWTSLLGTDEQSPAFAIIRPRLPSPSLRRRRSTTPPTPTIVLEADALGRRFELRLRQSRALLDPQFVMMARWDNRTEMLPNSLVEDSCYYQTVDGAADRAAVGICGGMRGIISSSSNDYYVINPLPRRFHKRSADIPHIVVKWHPDKQPEHNQATQRTTPVNQLKTFSTVPKFKSPDLKPYHFERNVSLIDDTDKSRCASILDDRCQNQKNRERMLLESSRRSWTGGDAKQKKRSVETPVVPVHVETAVFIDRDLFQHMTINFPTDTERELVRVVLAMINAVQLLYHDPSLGRQVNFVLKRLEILHVDPGSLQRPHDIDRFLSSFCLWQRAENPEGDSDPLHWDHALILTGLDLYVVSKGGKVSSQVVGLAPVAGMCTSTSSCTVNEGRHFESVYVVAHEIGHNLGMRHDGPSADNECDPGSFIMSPTLGSGKITWSTCSQRYLQTFLDTTQSRCLLDHSVSSGQLDHSAEGLLPGERFDANQQCMLKYGRGSSHSAKQELYDVCRDLHCMRERYTWTSHPALEGTLCGTDKWCRSGRCVGRGLSALQAGFSADQRVDGSWSEWSVFSDCASGCLFDNDGRLHGGSTGIMIASRRCNNPRAENGGQPCQGKDMRYQACNAAQCANVQRTTIRDFADQICIRASKIDSEVLGTGLQRISSDAEEACTVWCYKRNGGSKSRGWTFPDGTACQSRRSHHGKPMYCINGRCEEFVCDRYDAAIFTSLPELCPRTAGRLRVRDSSLFRLKSGRRTSVPGARPAWAPASGCHFNCLAPGKGLRLVVAKDKHCWAEEDCKANSISSIQLCQPDKLGCGRLKTPFEHATSVCGKYRERVRRLSGLGMQISPSKQDPDRPCRVACQDDQVNHRFYLVNGEDGWFPFGADCSRGVADKKAYCVSGKCLEFEKDDTPSQDSEYTLPLLIRPKRSAGSNVTMRSTRLQHPMLAQIIAKLNFTGDVRNHESTGKLSSIDFDNPIDVKEKTETFGAFQRPNAVLREESVNSILDGK